MRVFLNIVLSSETSQTTRVQPRLYNYSTASNNVWL